MPRLWGRAERDSAQRGPLEVKTPLGPEPSGHGVRFSFQGPKGPPLPSVPLRPGSGGPMDLRAGGSSAGGEGEEAGRSRANRSCPGRTEPPGQ